MPDQQQLHEAVGVLHVHTRLSDGSGVLTDILSAAEKTACDFVVLADHDTHRGRELGWEGWHNKVLVIVGAEVSPREKHALLLGAPNDLRLEGRPVIDVLREAVPNGAVCFVAHPDSSPKGIFKTQSLSRWSEEELNFAAGWEIWSYMHDWARDFRLRRLFQRFSSPEDFLSGPTSSLLSLWDRQLLRRPLPIIGALDAHAKRLPFGILNVFPYERCFAAVRTHVLLFDPLSGNVESDIANIISAIRDGNSFVARDDLRPAAGFKFYYESDLEDALMGQDAPWDAKGKITITVPTRAEIRVVISGKKNIFHGGDEYVFSPAEPGVYRVEVKLNGKPWIFSNAIRLLPRDTE
jgi:hypothetical protein